MFTRALVLTDAFGPRFVRRTFVDKFSSVRGELERLNMSAARLFHVFMRGTEAYRKVKESEDGEHGRVAAVGEWFQTVVDESGIATRDRGDAHNAGVTFNTLDPSDEAAFEWLAVETGLREEHQKPCRAVIAGGNGSVQVSMPGEFQCIASNQKNAIAHVSAHGVES